jgi:hypothetical protein
MPSFDYISSPDFREALSNDYKEMRLCAEQAAWKSAQVLAGSIVECLLVDYLASTSSPTRTAKDPLKLDLSEAISICKAEKVLSERTADLCSVVRSYRNLIHPGRMVRMNEDPPNKTTCDIAVALIDLIVADISRTRRAAVGFTAEQILSKVERDSNCLSILSHLLAEVSEEQRLRLTKTLIPEAYLERSPDGPFDEIPDRLEGAHRITFDTLNKSAKEEVTGQFVKILKEADGDRVTRYRNAFFRAPDIHHVAKSSQALVKEHLLGSPGSLHTSETLKVIEGIQEFLEPDDAMKWFDPLIRTILSTSATEFIKKRTREVFEETIAFTTKDFDKRLASRINDWVLHFEKLEQPRNLSIAKELQEVLTALGTPSAT